MVIGRMTRDPEVRTTPSGVSVASFSIATNYTWNDQNNQKQEKVEFHNVVVWRKLAEIVGQYLKKGSRVYVEGRLQTRDWEGQDGVKRYRTEIIADNLIMLDSKGSAGQNSTPVGASAAFGETQIPQADEKAEEEIKVENIPF